MTSLFARTRTKSNVPIVAAKRRAIIRGICIPQREKRAKNVRGIAAPAAVADKNRTTKEKTMSLLTDELVRKALAVQSAEELLRLALENDYEMTIEEAEEYFAMIRASV